MWLSRVVVVVAAVLVGLLTFATGVHVNDCRADEGGVYLAISSQGEYVDNSTILRWLEVHWYDVVDAMEGDWVGVWDVDPTEGLDNALSQAEVLGSDGHFVTMVSWDGSLVPTTVEGVGDACLTYWAGFVRDGKVIHSSCFKIRPGWMESQSADLRDTRLSKVAMPGTHDAGASGRIGQALIGDVVGRWTFTQDESFWEQLVFGVRYFDMRIAYYPETEEKLFVNHGEVRIAPLQGYVDDIVAFMRETQEIVIFDIHQFPHGFSGFPERHEELIAYLQLYFGEWLVPRNYYPDPTLGELWDANTRLIVTYPESSDVFWPAVYHLWGGDTNNLADLESFLYTGITQQEDRGSMWSAMAEFTPSTLDVSLNRWGGLRGAAAITNIPVTQWLRHDWWDKVNIVAMDFILSSDVITLTVEANILRKRCGDVTGGGRRRRLSLTGRRWWAGVTNTHHTHNTPSEARTWLTVSALASTSLEGQTTQRQLEMNWEVPEVVEGDWVGLFDRDPSDDWWNPLEQTSPSELTGFHLTNTSFPLVPVHADLAEGACLGFWVGYIREDTLVAADCFKVHPKWMSSLKEQLAGVTLRNLVWPAVHDAGTYTPYTSIADNALMKYAITQDESIYKQMVYGNRYIDLRAGYFSGDPDEPYWLVHGLTVWRPLREVLEQLLEFVQSTGEVVIAEVGGFTFFETSEHHIGCINLITEVLGDVMAFRNHTWDAPLGDLLQSGASLIVTYSHNEADSHEQFWPGIPGRWSNTQSLAGLEEYMIKVFEVDGPPTAPWSISGQLTPLADDVITDDLGSLRVMADEVNRNVTQWLRYRWWEQISVISCDFVLSAGYVEVAIDVNLRRAAGKQ